jgi:hypothetical protein
MRASHVPGLRELEESRRVGKRVQDGERFCFI